jgi:restriction endonuclease Mrr
MEGITVSCVHPVLVLICIIFPIFLGTSERSRVDAAQALRASKAVGGDGGSSRDSKIRRGITRAAGNQRIFITTSDFSRDANDYVSKLGGKIVLIDGSRLAELVIEFGVAVATDATYTVKRIDNDFFESI